MKTVILALACAASLLGVSARAATITFDDVPYGGCGPVKTAGLVFHNDHCVGAYDVQPVSNDGTQGLVYGYGPLTIYAEDGGTFALGRLQAGISFYSELDAAKLEVVGLLAGGGVFQDSFDIGRGLTTYVVDREFHHVRLGGLSDGYVAIDNVVLGLGPVGVPEPATWAMMIGGFGVAGAAQRRRKLATA